MSTATIGIDFGTTTSSMAWVDPRTGEAKVIKNAEGEEKTPSVVWFGKDDVLVGTPAEQMLEDPDECRRVVQSIKLKLVSDSILALPDRRVKAIDVAAEIFRKLKRDANELHFHAAVDRAVVTCPAAFDIREREAIEQAARLAGFTEVRTLEEPVAAALAYSRAGLGVGRHVLVYDLGGGTFDLALLREEGGGFALALPPDGLPRCGGDNFDAALYDWCDEEAERQCGQPLNGQGRDLKFLRDCRKRKENLSVRDAVPFSSLVGEGRVFKCTLTRKLFEELIVERVDSTVRLTAKLVREAGDQGFPVDTVVLIGGSSRIPLVQRKLKEALPVEPQKWQHQDVAVALGAAYFAKELWKLQPASNIPASIIDAKQDHHERDIEFYVKYEEAAVAFVEAVSGHYPWSEALIERYVKRWDWNRLSYNEALPWSEALIERYVERWKWFYSGMIHYPRGHIELRSLSCNEALPWSEELIKRFAEQWSWEDLSENQALPWSAALIERFAHRWYWTELSKNQALPWSEALIERFAKQWSWEELSKNQALPWNDALIERYAERWYWKDWLHRNISRNEALPWSEALIERYVERWSWNRLSENEALPWSEALIERYVERWGWIQLAGNKKLPWSEVLIEQYFERSERSERWSWDRLSGNEALPWSEALIERYVERWSWVRLSGNEALPWSEALIERYVKQWDWKALSENSALPWSEALIERYKWQWDWRHLSSSVLPELVKRWTESQICEVMDRLASRPKLSRRMILEAF